MSQNYPAIRVRNPGKRYTIGGPQEKYLTLRDAIVNSVKAPFKRFQSAPSSQEFWALKGCAIRCGAKARLSTSSGGMVRGNSLLITRITLVIFRSHA